MTSAMEPGQPPANAFALGQAMEILERTPGVLMVLLRGVSDAWLDERNEGPESFSPRDVVGHLVALERADWLGRVRRIINHGEAQPFDPVDRFAFRRETATPIDELLKSFSQLRAASLAELRALKLTPDHLAKAGTHPSFGRVTLEQLLATWVVHDLSHLAQIERVMGRRYIDAVGPWREYLTMLDRR